MDELEHGKRRGYPPGRHKPSLVGAVCTVDGAGQLVVAKAFTGLDVDDFRLAGSASAGEDKIRVEVLGGVQEGAIFVRVLDLLDHFPTGVVVLLEGVQGCPLP